MSHPRFVRGTPDALHREPRPGADGQLPRVRRQRSLHRVPTARRRAAQARCKPSSMPAPLPYAPRLQGVHDYGDGRHALEFAGPSLDLVLYHDRGVTIAEWVTVGGDLLALVAVGEC